MAITSSDIKFYLTGGAANADPNASLGGAISSTEWTGGTLHDLFDVVSGDENAASESEYRCICVKNTHATLTLLGAVVYIPSETAGGASIAIALDGAGKNGVAESIANENTAPSGESFSTPTTKGAGLVLGDLAPGDYFPIWIRRTTADTGAVSNDGATLRVEGDTEA